MKLTKAQREAIARPVIPYPEGMPIPQDIVEKRKYPGGSTVYTSMKKAYVYAAERVENVLIVTVYRMGAYSYRVFQWQDRNLVQLSASKIAGNISTASIGSIKQGAWDKYDSHNGEYTGAPGADDVIDAWLREIGDDSFRYDHRWKQEGTFTRLEGYQFWLRERVVERRHDAIRRSIHDDMLEIRELPKAVIDWITRGPLKSSRYIFYRYKPNKRKLMQGTCSYCQHEVTVKAPKHQETGFCPHCHSKVTYIADGRFVAGNGIHDEERFAYFQPTRAGYCIRFFEVRRSFTPRVQVHMQDYIHEYSRVFYDRQHEVTNRFDWGNFQNTGRHEWCRESSYDCGDKVHVYPGNLRSIVRDDERWRYMPLATIARECGKLTPHRLLTETDRWPWLEYLVKLKLYSLAGDVIRDNHGWDETLCRTGRNITEILGMKPTKDDLKDLQKLNPTVDEFALYRNIRMNTGKRINAEGLAAIRWWMDTVPKKAERVFAVTNIIKARKYIETQAVLRKQQGQLWNPHWGGYTEWDIYCKTCEQILSDWQDYIGECASLDYDLSDSGILFPRDLIAAHARTSELVEIKLDTEKTSMIRARAAKIDQRLKFEADGFIIRAVRSLTELTCEGKELHHCVAGYADDHAMGKTTIMVIRQTSEPDKPFYTLECDIKGKRRVQCRGLRNCSMTDEVAAFVAKWEKTKLKKSVLQSPARKSTRERVQVAV